MIVCMKKNILEETKLILIISMHGGINLMISGWENTLFSTKLKEKYGI